MTVNYRTNPFQYNWPV